jgi:hypothetical protein
LTIILKRKDAPGAPYWLGAIDTTSSTIVMLGPNLPGSPVSPKYIFSFGAPR